MSADPFRVQTIGTKWEKKGTHEFRRVGIFVLEVFPARFHKKDAWLGHVWMARDWDQWTDEAIPILEFDDSKDPYELPTADAAKAALKSLLNKGILQALYDIGDDVEVPPDGAF